MKRITPQEVIESYNRQNLKAIDQLWAESVISPSGEDYNRVACCAIGALVNERDPNKTISNALAQKHLGLSEVYVLAFVRGFDAETPEGLDMFTNSLDNANTCLDEIEAGYEDGLACRDAVTHAGLWLS